MEHGLITKAYSAKDIIADLGKIFRLVDSSLWPRIHSAAALEWCSVCPSLVEAGKLKNLFRKGLTISAPFEDPPSQIPDISASMVH